MDTILQITLRSSQVPSPPYEELCSMWLMVLEKVPEWFSLACIKDFFSFWGRIQALLLPCSARKIATRAYSAKFQQIIFSSESPWNDSRCKTIFRYYSHLLFHYPNVFSLWKNKAVTLTQTYRLKDRDKYRCLGEKQYVVIDYKACSGKCDILLFSAFFIWQVKPLQFWRILIE